MRDPTPRSFEIDLRSLAALRIGLGALLLADLAYRAADLEAHYTDAGVLPRVALRALFRDPVGLWSLHAASGAWAFQVALFVAAALCTAALFVGYRTRLATLLSWLLLTSLHHRNPVILTGADQVLRLLLFWSLFLPLDAKWAVRPAGVPRERSVCSPASAALLLQVALVYLFSVVFKLRGGDWLALTAIRDSLAVEGVATDWGRWLLHFPRVLSVAAAVTLVLEALAVVLPFLPWRRDAARLFAALALPGLHVLGVGLSMRLGLMPAVMTLAWVPFLPGLFWQTLGVGADGRTSPAPQTSRRLRPVHGLVVAAFALVAVENAASAVRTRANPLLPAPLRSAIEALGLSQEWKLWERPLRNRYYVFAATLRDGSQVDLHTGRALDWERPRRRSANNHWWKYQLHLSRRYGVSLRPWYARYLARSWNHHQPPERQVETLELVRIRADAWAEGKPERVRDVLWRGRPTPERWSRSGGHGLRPLPTLHERAAPSP